MRLTQEVEPIHHKKLQSRRSMAPRGRQKRITHGATNGTVTVTYVEPAEPRDPEQVGRAMWKALNSLAEMGRALEAQREEAAS